MKEQIKEIITVSLIIGLIACIANGGHAETWVNTKFIHSNPYKNTEPRQSIKKAGYDEALKKNYKKKIAQKSERIKRIEEQIENDRLAVEKMWKEDAKMDKEIAKITDDIESWMIGEEPKREIKKQGWLSKLIGGRK